MDKYEYQIISGTAMLGIFELDTEGQEGWRLVHITILEKELGELTIFHYYFVRKIS